MSSKTCLILFGLLIAFAVLSNAEDNSESSLSEEVASARVARSADAGKNKSKSSKKNKRKTKKAKKAAKIAAKMAAKKAKKASKKEAKKAKKEAKKSRKVKKTKQGEKNRQKNISQNERKSSRAVDGACLESAMTAMNRWKGVVANFNKQKSRIEKQSEIAGKKGAKKSVFGPIALKLVDLGGGNKSALTCSGSADSDGAKQLTNLTQTLFACEVEVNKTCSMDFPAPNMTFVDQCAMDIEMFENKTTECYDLSDADTAEEACACWTDAEYTELGNKIKGCKISETSDVAKGLKACKDAFSTCRKYEDDAVTAMGACVVSADTLQAKAAALSTNVDSVSAVSTKVAAVTGSSSRRSARAAATTCADFITLVAKLVAIVLDFPSSPEVLVVGGYILDSADPTCTEEEVASLVDTESSLTEAAEFLAEAFEEAVTNYEAATGLTLSAADLTTGSVSTTTMASRVRRFGFQRKLFRA